jgi:hypothetical protein
VFEVQGGFKWLLFPLTPAVLCNTDLMLPGEEHPSIHTWSKVLVGHIITLKAGEHIFLKGYDVRSCYDFDHLLSASQECEPNFFTNLPHECASVRQALKEREKKIASSTLSLSSDYEEDPSLARSKITSRPLTLPPRFNLKTEPSDHMVTLPHHTVKIEPTFIDLTMSDAEDGGAVRVPTLMDDALMDDVSPTPQKKKRTRSFSSLSASLSSTHHSSPNETGESSDDSPPAWPVAFYVVDIVRGFEKCDEAHRERRSVEKAFFKCFKVPFRSTTFYNHRRKWDNASAASRDAALRAGHTSAGLWTTFLKCSRAKGVESVDKKRTRKKRVLN